MLAGALGMVRHGFALGPLRNLRAAWHVMRANQAWAPYPANDPVAARQYMARFYRMAGKAGRLRVDPDAAAELELAWWRAHRAHQHDGQVSNEDLLAALVSLYCYIYQAQPDDVRRAAELRVQAMDLSDAWVAAGCQLTDPRLAQERLVLVASFTALRDVSDRQALQRQLPTSASEDRRASSPN